MPCLCAVGRVQRHGGGVRGTGAATLTVVLAGALAGGCGSGQSPAASTPARTASTRSPAPASTTSTATGTTTAPSADADCFAAPASCGFPSRSTTGVPRATNLTAYGGDLVVRTPGDVVQGVAVRGTIEIVASHVTVKDSSVTTPGSLPHDIWIAPSAHDVLIERTSLTAANATAGVEYAVQNAGGATNRGVGLSMSGCTTCWAGAGTLSDSYAIADATVAGGHYEAVYYGGGDGPLTVEHDTLLNPHDQASVVMATTDFGDLPRVEITDSLLAGGAFTLYGGATGGHGRVRGPVTITGNRFAACRTAAEPQAGGGHRCVGGADSHGYWPRGGLYGVATALSTSVTTWSGNVWDSTGQPLGLPR
jgi:hypothetical protein